MRTVAGWLMWVGSGVFFAAALGNAPRGSHEDTGLFVIAGIALLGFGTHLLAMKATEKR